MPITFLTDDFVEVGNDTSLDMGSGDFSAGILFKVNNNTINHSLWVNGATGAGGKRFFFQIRLVGLGHGGPSLLCDIDNNVARIFVETGAGVNPQDGNWHYAILMRDSGTLRLIYDNVEEDTDSIVGGYGSITSPNTMLFGAGQNTGGAKSGFLGGVIAEAFVYKGVALNSNEYSRFYQSRIKKIGLQIQSGNLSGLWPFDDGADGTSADTDTISDVSVNGNDGIGDDGAGSGLTWTAEEFLSYPAGPIYVITEEVVTGAIINQLQGPNLGADLFNGTLM